MSEAAPVQKDLVTGQSAGQAIPAEKGNSSGLVEGQSAPALSNVPVGGSASPSAGGPSTSLVDELVTLPRGSLAGSGSPPTGKTHLGSDSRSHLYGDSLGEEEKMNNNGGRF